MLIVFLLKEEKVYSSTKTESSVTVLGVSLRSSAVCAVVSRWRVDTGAGADLFTLPTRHGTVRPHRPRGPSTVH